MGNQGAVPRGPVQYFKQGEFQLAERRRVHAHARFPTTGAITSTSTMSRQVKFPLKLNFQAYWIFLACVSSPFILIVM
jgi:hypothetical protein